MLGSEKLAIAAHMHVLLRRKTGRVTDTEWMAGNLEYAIEIVRFARVRALEDDAPELAEWATKLEHAVLLDRNAPPAPVQLVPGGGAALPGRRAMPARDSGFAHSAAGESGFAESTLDPDKPRRGRDPHAPRYVGGIR